MKPTIIIEDEVYQKVMHWVNKSQYEVSGLGIVRVEKDGILRVIDAMLLPQKNGATHTDIEPEHVNKAMFDLRHSEGDLKWWWHSHVMMGVFWSGTDHDTIKKIGGGGWVAATVFNQKKEVKSCYYGAHGQQTPWGTEALFLDDLPTKIACLNHPKVAEWDAEYDKNVTVKPARQWDDEGDYMGTYYGKDYSKVGDDIPSIAPRQFVGEDSKWKWDEKTPPPLKKPKGMPKKYFQEWEQAHTRYVVRTSHIARKEGSGIVKLPALPGEKLDEYGLTDNDHTLLAMEGWSINDLDEMLDEGFCAKDCMRFAKLGVGPYEIDYLLASCNYTVDDVVKMADQSESFGENLFDNAGTYTRAREIES